MSSSSLRPDSQQMYQVRFDWGLTGAAAIAEGADAIVWVDELGEQQELPDVTAAVVAGGIANSAAVADWVIAKQAERGDRFRIAVVAAGEPRGDGSLRFAVEDLLGAGAVIDALTAVGIDHNSPEAAAASAAYEGLRRAVKHLVGASVSARELGGVHPDFTPSTDVTVLRGFSD
ncbi:2-phosphosulfolactate phosphatase [Salinibacterium sp. SYSU T00001]|uniref:2-phosphosulfolactate phosphatase n=1 Tax=Homoserinimonas sedimenticola TaxID=2986805 RepID=UPI0022356DE0|nr:2-phosphosulfolactate phosphatase [Salinibacterium sedimenticola]MCW4385343.1 2-phosphosulfolactate phosphatase [Salinibacterium sedimenticola]